MSDLQARLQEAIRAAYTIERELGGGGMSRVFVATETELGRKVVIKVLPPEMGAGVNVERFRREIQLAASLQHPHIEQVILRFYNLCVGFLIRHFSCDFYLLQINFFKRIEDF